MPGHLLASLEPAFPARIFLLRGLPMSNPLYFGPPATPMLGWFHAPEAQARDVGIVLCPPVGVEYGCSYHMLRVLAGRLAAADRLGVSVEPPGREAALASAGLARAVTSRAARPVTASLAGRCCAVLFMCDRRPCMENRRTGSHFIDASALSTKRRLSAGYRISHARRAALCSRSRILELRGDQSATA